MYLNVKKQKGNDSRRTSVSFSRNVLPGRQGIIDNRPVKKTHTSFDTVQRSSLVAQFFTDDDLARARDAASRVESLTIQQVTSWRDNIDEWLRTMQINDLRRSSIERIYHVFSRQVLIREGNMPHLVTRIIAPEQLARSNIGTNSVRRSEGSLVRNLNGRLNPLGNGTENMKRLYSFMRRFGGAGLQGFHGNPMDRIRVIHSILGRMSPRRATTSRRGPKFAMVAVDRRQLDQDNVMDTTDPAIRQGFISKYGRFKKMYQQHENEGVVAVKGTVGRNAIKGLRAFRGVPSKKALKKMIALLLDLASAEPEPMFKKFQKRDDDDRSGPGGGSTGGLLA